MVYSHQTVATEASDIRAQGAQQFTARSERRPLRNDLPLTRRYQVAGLAPSGCIEHHSIVAPATPVFEEAFASFAHGTLIQTTQGPVAVEDLYPGILVETAESGPKPLLWVGSMAMRHDTAQLDAHAAPLIRITADRFGLGRPMPDLMLGPRARLLYRNAACQALFGTPTAFAPARGFVDGHSLIAVTPVSAVRTYHLALDGQQVILANGLEVESYHPGISADTMMDMETRRMFFALFPHARTISDFGAMPVPRLTAFELDGMRAA